MKITMEYQDTCYVLSVKQRFQVGKLFFYFPHYHNSETKTRLLLFIYDRSNAFSSWSRANEGSEQRQESCITEVLQRTDLFSSIVNDGSYLRVSLGTCVDFKSKQSLKAQGTRSSRQANIQIRLSKIQPSSLLFLIQQPFLRCYL